MKRPSKKASRGKKAAAKKLAVKKTLPKKIRKRAKKARAKKAAAPTAGMRPLTVSSGGPLGCCTIKPAGEADYDIPHISERDCHQRALAEGAVYHWRPGECAGV